MDKIISSVAVICVVAVASVGVYLVNRNANTVNKLNNERYLYKAYAAACSRNDEAEKAIIRKELERMNLEVPGEFDSSKKYDNCEPF